MTVERLQTALDKIDEFYRLHLTDAERKTRAEVCAYTLKDISDDVAMQALMRAFTTCRYPSQLLVDWCAEIRKAQATAGPGVSQLWQQAQGAARQISQYLYWAQSGGLVTAEGRLSPTDLREQARAVFDALPAAVRAWAGSPYELDAIMSRPYSELSQYVRPGFERAMTAAEMDDRKTAALPPSAAGRLDAPRVDRAEPSGNDYLAERPWRHKGKE